MRKPAGPLHLPEQIPKPSINPTSTAVQGSSRPFRYRTNASGNMFAAGRSPARRRALPWPSAGSTSWPPWGPWRCPNRPPSCERGHLVVGKKKKASLGASCVECFGFWIPLFLELDPRTSKYSSREGSICLTCKSRKVGSYYFLCTSKITMLNCCHFKIDRSILGFNNTINIILDNHHDETIRTSVLLMIPLRLELSSSPSSSRPCEAREADA